MAVKFGAEEDVTQEEIREKLRLHRLWIDGEEGGAMADLGGADLHGADLSGADLSDADLSDADLRRTDLSDANFTGANLRRTDLSDANLTGVDLRGATGNGKEVKSAEVHTYGLVWTKDAVWIGCQCKTLDEWRRFDPRADGLSEEDCANWEAHKDWILETVRRFPAE